MNAVSPLRQLQFSPELACEFFGVFGRFEFALKEAGYRRAGRYNTAEPDWERFAIEVAPSLEAVESPPFIEAIQYLLDQPPLRQVIENNSLQWRPITFPAEWGKAQKVLLAARVVRNNLFHGGKHNPHSVPGRDEKLVSTALAVLYECLRLHDQVRIVYDTAF